MKKLSQKRHYTVCIHGITPFDLYTRISLYWQSWQSWHRKKSSGMLSCPLFWHGSLLVAIQKMAFAKFVVSADCHCSAIHFNTHKMSLWAQNSSESCWLVGSERRSRGSLWLNKLKIDWNSNTNQNVNYIDLICHVVLIKRTSQFSFESDKEGERKRARDNEEWKSSALQVICKSLR